MLTAEVLFFDLRYRHNHFMGLALWLSASALAFAITRAIPPARNHSRAGELAGAIAAALACGALATALDFGGWRELEWRSVLLAGLGALIATGLIRITLLLRSRD